jgi:phage terminase large subunit-like protein
MIKSKTRHVDSVTRDWIRCPGDELAALNGCRFDGERGEFVIDWMRTYLRLYEGEFAGEPFECRDWQREAVMRMFSWIRLDQEWSQRKGRPTWIRRFNQAVIFIPKKNKKSPTLAALGLYLTCGDGEQGGKTFFFAKDGQQSREIAGKHALEMLKQSPELMAECSINKSTLQITHEPTRSMLRPESSGDDRTQKAKEGINGNVLVDEVHVVDRRLMERVSRAGISRMEPFQIEVSTAGNDPDSYGKTRFEYARDVLDGRCEDERLFVLIHSAPQDVTDRDLDRNPVRYGRMANPAWGHTISEREFLSDYESSKREGASGLAAFRMYRLNIWQKTANPMLSEQAWCECQRTFSVADLAGRGGGLGLDLSKNEDMSAAVFCVPDPDDEGIAWVLPRFWMTRDYAESNNHLASFLNWAEAGHLQLVDGVAIADGDLLPWLLDAIEVIKPELCCYDAHYAEGFAQKLNEATDLEVAKFNQTFPAYSEPTVEFAKAVLGRRVRQDGNQVMRWQVGHVMAKEQAGLIKPIKDDKQRHRKIDGVQAAIMAHFAMRTCQPERSVYEDRGPILI